MLPNLNEQQLKDARDFIKLIPELNEQQLQEIHQFIQKMLNNK